MCSVIQIDTMKKAFPVGLEPLNEVLKAQLLTLSKPNRNQIKRFLVIWYFCKDLYLHINGNQNIIIIPKKKLCILNGKYILTRI